MYQFDGADIHQQDRVYVVGLGPATVIDVKANGFRIRVAGRTRKVNFQGVASGDSYQSVFWKNPIIAKPAKNNMLWSQQAKLALAAMNALGAAVVGQELIELYEPEIEEVATNATNEAALQGIIAEANAAERDRVSGTPANVTNIVR